MFHAPWTLSNPFPPLSMLKKYSENCYSMNKHLSLTLDKVLYRISLVMAIMANIWTHAVILRIWVCGLLIDVCLQSIAVCTLCSLRLRVNLRWCCITDVITDNEGYTDQLIRCSIVHYWKAELIVSIAPEAWLCSTLSFDLNTLQSLSISCQQLLQMHEQDGARFRMPLFRVSHLVNICGRSYHLVLGCSRRELPVNGMKQSYH